MKWRRPSADRVTPDKRVPPAEHHARYCEAVGPKPQGPLENCPFRPWHEGKQEPR